MTSDQDAFLRTICEYPHDLRPRLVYADWLDENDDGANGFAARAEFIRLMCDGQDAPHALWKKVFPLGDSPYHPRTEDGINVGNGQEWFTSEVYNAEWTQLPRGLVRNGFVEEVRCPLDWWVGGECGRCAGTGIYTDDEMRCVACHGTGRTPANGPSVVSRHPVARVVVTDREPWENEDGSFSWWMVYHGTSEEPADIEEVIWKRLKKNDDGQAIYPTREAAEIALSRALVDIARDRAGLTTIQWEVTT